MSGERSPRGRDREEESPPLRKVADASYDRPPANRAHRRLMGVKRLFLLDMDRLLLTGVLSFGVFVFVVVAGTFGSVPAGSFLDAGISPGSVLVELLKMIASVVVIVLSINQLVLSPGLGSVGDQRERFEQSMDLRDVSKRTPTSGRAPPPPPRSSTFSSRRSSIGPSSSGRRSATGRAAASSGT